MEGKERAAAEGDLDVTSKDLKVDVAITTDLHHNRMTKAQDFEAAVKSRSEELKALVAAKTTITESAGGCR